MNNKSKEPKKWFRIDDGDLAYVTKIEELLYPEAFQHRGDSISIFYVARETRCYVYLAYRPGGEPFRKVLKTAKRRWACPSIKEALESYQARKIKHVRITQAQLAVVEENLMRVERLLKQLEIKSFVEKQL